MLEKMGEFFNNRIEGYDNHQMEYIDNAQEIYSFTAKCLPAEAGVHVLDLGCGTGLELEKYFENNPYAKITGVDLSQGMLNKLKSKFAGKDIKLVLGSYFDVPFGDDVYDAAVSVESLHHFTLEEKVPLYTKIQKALKDNGFFILTDFFSLTEQDEKQRRKELIQIRKEQNIKDDEFYHYDTPLTVQHEIEALTKAGFTSVEIVKQWGVTSALKAHK